MPSPVAEPRSFDDVLAAYRGRRVLVTGLTGFKGGWLATWLARLGAEVTGLSLPPPGDRPSLFRVLGLDRVCVARTGDVRDLAVVRRVIDLVQPQVIFHLAAQPLVRASYDQPLDTFAVNIMGTANLLEAVRLAGRPCAVVAVTSDKCYEPRGARRAFKEGDPLGGHDPYSASKAAAEVVAGSYARAFFPPELHARHRVAVATVRAGNVIGGGDWARDRIVPDVIDALVDGRQVILRSPDAVRPWQHVAEALAGYLEIGARLVNADARTAATFAGAWNFGPHPDGVRTVRDLVDAAIGCWGGGRSAAQSGLALVSGGATVSTPATSATSDAKHESHTLELSIDKALDHLLWRPRWSMETAVAATVAWYRAYHAGADRAQLAELTIHQLLAYEEAARAGDAERLAS